jgi:DNA-binding MarR family transcriptional regulator
MYSLAELIERLSQSMQDHEEGVIRASEFANLTLTQIHYLDAIRHFETPPTLSKVAECLDIAKPTATNAIDRLENDGYVRKVPSADDRRVWYVYLTTKGLRISDLHDQIHQGYAENFEKSLNKEELDLLVVLLNKVIKHIGI